MFTIQYLKPSDDRSEKKKGKLWLEKMWQGDRREVVKWSFLATSFLQLSNLFRSSPQGLYPPIPGTMSLSFDGAGRNGRITLGKDKKHVFYLVLLSFTMNEIEDGHVSFSFLPTALSFERWEEMSVGRPPTTNGFFLPLVLASLDVSFPSLRCLLSTLPSSSSL